jgi:tetratricopeptide (TPR) repeat protein
MAADFATVRAIFEAALELPRPARDAFVAERCGDDPALRAEVEQLLAADASETAFAQVLDGSAIGLAGLGDPLPGLTIANFRLGHVLGSGGMGTVYAAEQLEPRRQVALKVMSLGFASPAAVARFRFEAELLARLSHPHIAAIHAAGVHRLGQVELPWFALELVVGATDVQSHATARRLDTRARIGLLLDIAAAVHHGHLHGVVHRDLKPQNVLVGADGIVKVIDFGIARSTEVAAADTPTPHTERGHVLGTIAYMSPEQLAGEVVDHRTDVFALGALAFELLGGQRAFALEGLPAWRAAEVVATTAPRALGSVLPGCPRDLEVVVQKALRKDPAARYESAAAFAADLRAVLEARPVSARPTSALHHVRLFARRRRGLVLALLGIAATIAVAVATLLVQNQTLQRRERAAQRIARFCRDVLAEADATRDRGSDYTVREALDVAAAAMEHEAFPEPGLEAELRLLLGQAYRSLSLPAVAEPQLRRAQELYAAATDAAPDGGLTTGVELATVQRDQGQTVAAERLLRELATQAVLELPADDPWCWRLEHELALTARAAGRLAEAEAGYRRVLAARERLLGPHAAPTLATQHSLGTVLLAMDRDPEAHAVLHDCLARHRAAGANRVATWQVADSLGEACRELGQLEAAAATHRQAMDGYRELLGPDHALTLGCAFHLLKALHRLGDRDGMRALAQDLLPRCERTFGPEHPKTMDVLAAAALARFQAGDRQGAIADFERAFAVQQRQRGEHHPDALLAGQNLAQMQLQAGAAAAALMTTTQLVARLPAASDLPPLGAAFTRLLHARALAATGDPAGATTAATAARAALPKELGADHPLRGQIEQVLRDAAATRTGG